MQIILKMFVILNIFIYLLTSSLRLPKIGAGVIFRG